MNTTIRYITALCTGMLLLGFTAGCSTKQAAPPPKPDMGVLHMAKAIKAHPLYPEVDKLEKQRSSLQAQLMQQQEVLAAAGRKSELDLTNLAKATEQEFQTKMAGRQADLSRQLQAQSEALRQQINEQVDKYVRELDESYQDRNFALQVKLKTIDLSKEEQAAIQKQMEEIQSERMEKIVARQQQLTAQMTEQMQQAEQAAAQELDEYAKQLKQQLDSEFAKRSQAMKTLPGAALTSPSGAGSLEARLEATDRELAKLRQDIIADIKNRAAAVAQAQGLATVLADVEIFTDSASDITADVIAGSK